MWLEAGKKGGCRWYIRGQQLEGIVLLAAHHILECSIMLGTLSMCLMQSSKKKY